MGSQSSVLLNLQNSIRQTHLLDPIRSCWANKDFKSHPSQVCCKPQPILHTGLSSGLSKLPDPSSSLTELYTGAGRVPVYQLYRVYQLPTYQLFCTEFKTLQDSAFASVSNFISHHSRSQTLTNKSTQHSVLYLCLCMYLSIVPMFDHLWNP